MAASGSLRKCASISAWAICARMLLLRVGLQAEGAQAVVDGLEMRAVAALRGVVAVGRAFGDHHHDLLVLQLLLAGRRYQLADALGARLVLLLGLLLLFGELEGLGVAAQQEQSQCVRDGGQQAETAHGRVSMGSVMQGG